MKNLRAPLKMVMTTLLVVAVFTALKLALNYALKIESPLLLYYSAVIVAAWLGGFYQGLLAAAVSLLCAIVFYNWPVADGHTNSFRAVLFVVDCLFIISFAWALERSRRRAHLALAEATSAQRASDLSEARFRRIFESNMIGLIFTRDDGTILDANGYFLEMLGYTREDLKTGTLNWQDFTPKEFLPASRRAYELMRREGVAPPFEKAYFRKDGSVVEVLVGAAPLDEDKTVKFVLDITERKKTENALSEAYAQLEERVGVRTIELRQSQSFLDSVIENIPNMLFVKDAADLKFMRFNKAGEALLGYPREELIGKSDFDFFPKAEAEFFVAKDRAVLQGGIAVDIPEEPLSTRFGLRYLHTKKIPILGKDGTPKYLLGISEDVTERKHAEQQRLKLMQEQAARVEAEKSADQLRFLAEVSSALNESLDPKPMLTNVARLVVANLSDWCSIDLLSEDHSVVLEPVIAHRDPEKVKWAQDFRRKYPVDLNAPGGTAHVIRTGQPVLYSKILPEQLEAGLSKAASQEVAKHTAIHSVMMVPLQSYGNVLGTLTISSAESGRTYTNLDLSMAVDLARRVSFAIENARLFAKAQEASRAKSAFLANMSHEIRTPLGAMLGFTELLADDGLNLNQRQYLSTIAKNGQHLLRIVDEILDLSKVESDHIQIENIEFSLPALLTEVFSPLRMQAREKGLSFRAEIAGLPEKVVTDPTRLRQILINVVGNAIKFTPKGEISVGVELSRHSSVRGRSVLQISVSDTGIGITPEQEERLFQPFVQADNSMTRRFGGTGLGLFLSRRLAQLLGGDVVLNQSSGQGSRFVITSLLQVKDNDSSAPSPPAQAPEMFEPKASRGEYNNVLIVDDAPDNRTLIYHYVSRLGYHADVAENGAEAVEKALSQSYDVILMDVQMPEMDGFEAVKILRSKNYTGPIIALTAHSMKGDRERCLANGFTDYLGKPIDRDLLRRSLAKYSVSRV